MLTVSNLSKRYGNVFALQNVSFHLKNKESAGIFGVPGSGKSTLSSLLSGFIECRPGQIIVDGLDLGKSTERARRLIGYLPEGNPLYGDMTVGDFLGFVCALYKVPAKSRRPLISDALELCGLERQKSSVIRDLSALDARRVGLAGALVFGPSLLLLDRPTFALRTEDAAAIRGLLASLRGKYTMLLLTDSITEVTGLCEHVIVLNRGHVVSDGSLKALASTAGSNNRLKLRVLGSAANLRALFASLPGVQDVSFERTNEPGTVDVLLEIRQGMDLREEIWHLAAGAQLPILEMRQISVSLEDIFLQLTGNGGSNA